MAEAKRLTGFCATGIDSKGERLSFALESEGGARDDFVATDEVFGGLVRLVLEIDQAARQRRSGIDPRSADTEKLLQPAREIELVIDLTGENALLRARTGLRTMVQIELSEDLLCRIQEKVPPILAELRRRRGASH